VASLHPAPWKEVEEMARTTGKRLVLDVRPAIESLGLDRVIEQVGLDRVIEQVGIDRVIEQVGKKRLVRHLAVEDIFANLSPAQRQELKRA
jgi:hypothetical protein